MTSVLHSQLKKEDVTLSLIPTLKFVGVGILWIVLSDLVLFFTQKATIDHFPIFHVEILKGILFVLAMGTFFFFVQRKNTEGRELGDLDLFRKNPQAMFVYNLETLQFLDVNEAALSTYGYSRAEFLSMKISDIRPAEDLPALISAIEQLQNGQRFIGNSRHIHKDKSIIPVEISAFSIIYNRQHAGLIMSNNISNQIKAEQALVAFRSKHEKQMNDRLYEVALFNKELQVRIREINGNNDELIEVNKLLLHASRTAAHRYEAKIQRIQHVMSIWAASSPAVCWTVDLTDADGSCISKGAMDFYGCSHQTILDRPNFWEAFIHPRDQARVKEEMLRLNETVSVTIEYQHIDGETRIRQQVDVVLDEDSNAEKIIFRIEVA